MTVFVVQAAGDDDRSLTRARFIPEGFSWAAFIYAQIWLLYHRLWIPLAVWVVLEIAFILLILPHVGGTVAVATDALAHLFIGLEGNRLRQGARRAAVTELVEARDRGEAEALFFHRMRPADGASA